MGGLLINCASIIAFYEPYKGNIHSTITIPNDFDAKIKSLTNCLRDLQKQMEDIKRIELSITFHLKNLQHLQTQIEIFEHTEIPIKKSMFLRLNHENQYNIEKKLHKLFEELKLKKECANFHYSIFKKIFILMRDFFLETDSYNWDPLETYESLAKRSEQLKCGIDQENQSNSGHKPCILTLFGRSLIYNINTLYLEYESYKKGSRKITTERQNNLNDTKENIDELIKLFYKTNGWQNPFISAPSILNDQKPLKNSTIVMKGGFFGNPPQPSIRPNPITHQTPK